MRKFILTFIILIILIPVGLIIYSNLPVEISRKSDIKFGNELVLRIENYKKTQSQLPLNDDWKLLEQLGFKTVMLGTSPSYQRINDDEYELIYFEGFDGPYLLFNSKEKQWKVDFPKFPENETSETEANYPWTKKITEIAVQAILTSIDNMNNTNLSHDKNFPTDINNTPFTQKEKTDFIIVGYSNSEGTPNIYQIDFQPKNKYKSGSRITVEIDIVKEKAIRVFMSPDA